MKIGGTFEYLNTNAFYGQNINPLNRKDLSQERVKGKEECQSCENRKYKDESGDPGVSYKTPTRISPEQASTAVRGHEMEHVAREQTKALSENRKVVSQSVSYQNAICPECGSVYLSGGTTRTVTGGKQEGEQPVFEGEKMKGIYVDKYI